MRQTEAKDRVIPPYVSYRSFKNFVESLRQAIPARIDRSLMPSMSGQIQTRLIAGLRYLRLVELDDAPTDRLVRLVNAEGAERQTVLREVIENAYPFFSEDGFSLSSTTPSHLDEKFKLEGATGDTVRRCVAFLLAATDDAGMSLSPYLKKKTRGKANTTPRPRRTTSRQRTPPPPPQEQPLTITWEQMLLSKFPSFDPTWPDDVKAKWFDAFDKLMGKKPAQDN